MSDAKSSGGGSWLQRLRQGLSQSSSRLGVGIGQILRNRRLDDQALEELEDLLISADLGVKTAAHLTAALARQRFDREISPEQIRRALAAEIEPLLAPVAQPLPVLQHASEPLPKPYVLLVCGANGSGKTTTIGKLAHQLRGAGRSVLLSAGDTFRAAAVEQLQAWGQRTGCPVIARDTGADAAGLAYDAVATAQRDGVDVLMIDTAGRLQNRSGLMDELKKIIRVIKKVDPQAPHGVLLVLDATIGQNAHSQVEVFKEMVDVTGLVVTKLDGTARGGVLVALAHRFGLPVHAIGVGEQADDLRPFTAQAFARNLLGLE